MSEMNAFPFRIMVRPLSLEITWDRNHCTLTVFVRKGDVLKHSSHMTLELLYTRQTLVGLISSSIIIATDIFIILVNSHLIYLLFVMLIYCVCIIGIGVAYFLHLE